MTLKAGELDDVAREIARVLGGRTLQKVYQPDEVTILLGFSRGWMLLAADARLGRLHLLDAKPPGTGEAAPPFCMLLRKELAGLALAKVTVPAGERACELTFAKHDDVRRLQLFLYGGSSRLQLAGEDRILGAIGPGKRNLELPPPRAPDERAPPPSRFPRESPSAAIAAHFAEAATASAHAEVEQQRRQHEKKLERLIVALRGDRDRAVAAGERKQLADLLLAHLHEVQRGLASITLPNDFADGEPVMIALDPALSPKDNVAKLYKEHKRLTRALGTIESRLADAEKRLANLRSGNLVLPAPKPRATAKKHREQRPTPPYRAYRSATGMMILVGRGSDRNDDLTFKVARGNDLWLHTRDVPGAHVVVPVTSKPVDGETLLDAAMLAAHHSNARGEAQVDVSYVARKHVRKPPRAAPGVVTLSGAKTIRVRLESQRLERLMKTRVDED